MGRPSPEAAPMRRPSVLMRAASSTLISAKIFECYSPPPINSLSGALVPRQFVKHRKRRKVSIEVHKHHETNLEECIVRILDPSGRRDDDETDGNSTVGATEIMDSTYDSSEYEAGWRAKYRFPLKAVSLKGTHKTGVLLQIQLRSLKQVRELIFDTQEEAEQFVRTLREEQVNEGPRNKARLSAALDGRQLEAEGQITFLIEVVSAWDIPAGDFISSDPYVEVVFNDRPIHRTKYLSKTLDPVWTIKTESLCLLKVGAKELFLSEGLFFVLKDFDKVGGDETLGTVSMKPREVYDAKGERMEFKLEDHSPKPKAIPGHMAVRVRRASDYDNSFMENHLKADSKQFARLHKAMADGKSGAGNIASIISKRTKVATSGKHAGKKMYKMRPGPDPARPEETTWMVEEDILRESLDPSQNWVDAGNGRLGRVFVEVIGANGLPQLDVGGFAGNLTDAFVSLVFEDAVVRTDVIDDSLNPRWMPWTQRAFIFHMFHSSSQLLVGVFDHDSGANPADDHDPIGRVSVDISNLKKDTTYLLKYPLYTSARIRQADQQPEGTITIRVRLEIFDERKVLLSNLEPPPHLFVNAKTRKDFRVLRYTCIGKFDTEKYNIRVINAYVEELLATQKQAMFYVQDGAVGLFLWRGTLPIKIGQQKVSLPVHSMTAFAVAITCVEHPQILPCLFFGGLAWLMIAANGYRRSIPNVWLKCKSFTGFAQVLLFGSAPKGTRTIKPYENLEATKAYIEHWERRVREAEERVEKQYEASMKERETYEKEMEEIGEEQNDISSKTGGVSIDPFKPILFPVQQNLAMALRYLRMAKHVLTWEECYISFWVTIGCALLSVVCFFIPWLFVIRWISRLLVWAVFGPWMKLVDIHYVSKMKPLTEAEEREKERKMREERMLKHSEAVSAARIRRENASKLKAMKKYMFGKFIIRIPVLKEDRYKDYPDPESSATPYTPDPRSLSELAMEEVGYRKTRLPGQHLEGDMIPKAETVAFTEAPVGQATAKPALLDKSTENAAFVSGPDSTAAAYAKIASLVVTAGVVTWFGVPILAAVTEYTMQSAGELLSI